MITGNYYGSVSSKLLRIVMAMQESVFNLFKENSVFFFIFPPTAIFSATDI